MYFCSWSLVREGMDGGRDGSGWAKGKHKGESGEIFVAEDVDVLLFETLLAGKKKRSEE